MSKAETIGSKKPSSNQDQTRIDTLEKEFDPYEHGVHDGYGIWGAAVHIFRYTFGTGILMMPYTLKTVGFVNGLVLQVLVNIFYYHIMHILISHEYRLCKLLRLKQITYSGLAEKTLENAPFPLNEFGALLSKVLLVYFAVTAYTSTYLLVFADSVQNLAKYFNYHLDTTFIITVAMVPILIFCMFQRLLKILVPFSAASNFLSMAMAAVVVIYSVIRRVPTARVRPFVDLKPIPQTVAAYIQAIICTPSLLPIKNYMRQPQRMGSAVGALNITAPILTFLFMCFSFLCYFSFGDDVKTNILLNLPNDSQLSVVIFFLYAIVMLVIYLLGFSIILDNVWPDLERQITNRKLKVVLEYGTRITLNVWAYILAVGTGNLGLILTISGSLAIIFEVALVPALELAFIFLCERKCLWTIFKDSVLIVICVSLSCVSLVFSIQEA